MTSTAADLGPGLYAHFRGWYNLDLTALTEDPEINGVVFTEQEGNLSYIDVAGYGHSSDMPSGTVEAVDGEPVLVAKILLENTTVDSVIVFQP